MTSTPPDALPNSGQNMFFDDVIKGLSQKQKTLPCKYFYDDEGARLFEQITQLPEYYPTRTELSILSSSIKKVVELLPSNATVIEPGCGSGEKVAYLLDALADIKSFIPLEISTEMLQFTQTRLEKRFPKVPIHSLHGDFTHAPTIQTLVEQHGLQCTANVVFFPGSTLGNFGPQESVDVLNNLRLLSGLNGAVLIGIDLVKAEQRLISAYDDNQGVTRAFNKNLLVRMARELGARIPLANFEHEARFNAQKQRVEMHLVANKPTQIRLGNNVFEFQQHESIHTENAYKYTLESFAQVANSAKLEVKRMWQDKNKDFALCLLNCQ